MNRVETRITALHFLLRHSSVCRTDAFWSRLLSNKDFYSRSCNGWMSREMLRTLEQPTNCMTNLSLEWKTLIWFHARFHPFIFGCLELKQQQKFEKRTKEILWITWHHLCPDRLLLRIDPTLGSSLQRALCNEDKLSRTLHWAWRNRGQFSWFCTWNHTLSNQRLLWLWNKKSSTTDKTQWWFLSVSTVCTLVCNPV